jgi:hypothetical protein
MKKRQLGCIYSFFAAFRQAQMGVFKNKPLSQRPLPTQRLEKGLNHENDAKYLLLFQLTFNLNS